MASPKPDAGGQLTYNASGDINKLLEDIYKAKTPDFTGTASKTTDPIYAPLIADIKKQGDASTATAGRTDLQLKSMYNKLQSDIGREGLTIRADTDRAVGAQKANTAQGVAAIGQNFQNAQQGTADILAKLGIQAAAPDALAKGMDQQGFLQSLATASGTNAVNLATQLGANAQNYNSAQRNIAGAEGNQKRADVKTQLTKDIAALRTRRSEIKSQAAQQNVSLASQLRDQYTNSQNGRASSLVSAFQSQQQMQAQLQAAQLGASSMTQAAQIGANASVTAAQINANAATAAAKAQANAQAKAAEAKSKADIAKINANAGKLTSSSPVGQRIYSYAAELFGTQTSQGSKAVALATEMAKKQYANAQQYADAVVHKAGRGAPSDKLRALAFTMWNLLQNNPNLENFLGK